MDWINALILVVSGFFIGLLVAWFMLRDNAQHKDLKKALEKSQNELEQYRQELAEHFAGSADLLDNISRDYSKLYSHMAKSSSDLMPNQPEQDNPFSNRMIQIPKLAAEPQDIPKQPLDYSDSPSGLLKDNKSTRQVKLFTHKPE